MHSLSCSEGVLFRVSACPRLLYSLCLNTNTFPQYWKRAFVQPIPKKGSRSDPSNYRPIALTCVLSKNFETFLNSDSWIIWSLILFSQITSMAFDARGQLVTYFPILLIYGLLPLGTSGSLVWWRLTYPRLLTGYGMRRCSPSSLPR